MSSNTLLAAINLNEEYISNEFIFDKVVTFHSLFFDSLVILYFEIQPIKGDF